MRGTHSLFATVALLGFTCAALLTLSAGRVYSATGGCMVCIPNGCQLNSNEVAQRIATTWIPTCIDFDADGVGHCCTTERQEFDIYERSSLDPNYGTLSGNCYKMVCAAAVPTSVLCQRGWVPSGKTAPRQLGAPTQEGCTLPGG